jgi:hypothetical protein
MLRRVHVTRAILESVIGDLKGRAGFRLRGRPLNREYDELACRAPGGSASTSAGDGGRAAVGGEKGEIVVLEVPR